MYYVYCGWHKKYFGKEKRIHKTETKGTHGICPECLKKQLKELEEYDKLNGRFYEHKMEI